MLEDLSGAMEMKQKKLKPCFDCKALIRLNALRCKPCSEENRLKMAKVYSKSK